MAELLKPDGTVSERLDGENVGKLLTQNNETRIERLNWIGGLEAP